MWELILVILITAGCFLIALKGRFAAKPFWTLRASVPGVIGAGSYIACVVLLYDELHWLEISIAYVMGMILASFIWMFFRSLIDLREIDKKLQEIADDYHRQIVDRREKEQVAVSTTS